MGTIAVVLNDLRRDAASMGKKHWALSAAVFVALIGLSLWIGTTATAQELNAWQSQAFVKLSHFETTPGHITTVKLDDGFFYGLNHGRSPMAPALIAKVIDALAEVGASVIAIDLDFRDPFVGAGSDPEYMAELATLKAAICTSAARVRVVLPATISENGRGIHHSLLDTLPCSSAGITDGFVNLTRDRRYVPLAMYDEYSRRVVLSMELAIVSATPGGGLKDPFVERIGLHDVTGTPPMAPLLDEGSIPSYSAAMLLTERAERARDQLSGRVALIMGSWHERAQNSGSQVDMHPSPVGLQAGGFMLASKAESIMTRRLYRPVSPSLFLAGEVIELGALTFVLGCIQRGSLKIGLVVAALGFNLCTAWLLSDFGVMVDAVLTLAMLIVHPLADQILEWFEISHNWRTRHVQT